MTFKLAMKKIIYAVLIFLVPTIVSIVNSVLGDLGVEEEAIEETAEIARLAKLEEERIEREENKKKFLLVLLLIIVMVIVSIYINHQTGVKVYLSDSYIYIKESYTSDVNLTSELPYINIKGEEISNINTD